VIFSARDNLDSLTPAVALCLFRVAQEALSNAARHARAHSITVQLMTTHEGVELRVVDDGIGFVASERTGSGLGLRSIDERVRLTKARVTVESRPGHGTNLLVRIPACGVTGRTRASGLSESFSRVRSHPPGRVHRPTPQACNAPDGEYCVESNDRPHQNAHESHARASVCENRDSSTVI